jgi:hypothetical protein
MSYVRCYPALPTIPENVVGTNYFVDNSATYDWDGLVDQAAPSAGQAGWRNDLQAFFDGTTLTAGDVVYVRNGNATYVTTSNGGGNYHVMAGGSACLGTGKVGGGVGGASIDQGCYVNGVMVVGHLGGGG